MNKILLISSNSSSRGGGERYLVFLARGLIRLNYEVYALLSDVEYMNIWAKDLSDEGVIVHRRKLKGLTHRPLRFLQAMYDKRQIKLVSDFCNEIMPEAILVNQQYDEDGIDFLMGAIRSNVASVGGVIHMPMTQGKNSRKFGRIRGFFLSRWYRANFYRIIFVSKGSQKEFELYYKLNNPTYVVNNGTPLENYITEEKGGEIMSRNKPVIGFVGQFCFQKDVMRIVEVWAEVRKTLIDCKLLLVGDGPERVKLENYLLNFFPSESYNITGWTEVPEIYFNKMDVFILTSRFEGLPLSLVEAVSRGVPAVISPFNGASDVAQHAHWVKIVNDNTVKAISNMVISALTNKLKKPTRIELEKFRNYFSVERMAKETIEILDKEGN
jgi:glycosyltransferase involved in cell wall biosynthesis